MSSSIPYAPTSQDRPNVQTSLVPGYEPPPELPAAAYPDDSRCASGVVLFVDEDKDQLVVVPTLCHRWDCPVCGPIRLRKAKAMALAGNPDRIITLTTRPKFGWSTEASIKWFRKRWQRLLTWLRRNFPRLEYMAFTELHKHGWPHMHILTRGVYVPQRMLSAEWMRLTGSFMVYIQAVKRTWKAINECTKYCLKTARQLHEAAPRLPVYTKSRAWLPEDWEDDKPEGDHLTPYTYARTSWHGFLEHLEALGGDLVKRPGAPRHFTVHFRAPPDPKHVALIYDIGSFSEIALVSALDLFFSSSAGSHFDIADARNHIDYSTSMPGDR